MEKFAFDFNYESKAYMAECVAVPIDGSTELHVTPLDPDLFEAFGIRLLSLQTDGTISAEVPPAADERDYIFALADGLSNFYSGQRA